MAVRKIVRGDKNFFLRKLKCKPIYDLKRAGKIAQDLLDTLVASNGVGLSAIQINEHYRIIVVKPDKEKAAQVMINPVIVEKSEELVDSDEACFSVPYKYGKVKRHKEIKVQFLDLNNNNITGMAYDIESFIIQHEIDHLDGILFTDKCEEIQDIREQSQGNPYAGSSLDSFIKEEDIQLDKAENK